MEKTTTEKASDERESEGFSVNSVALPVLVGVSLVSILGGFGATIALTRRKHPDAFMRSQAEGGRIAFQALGWATVISCGGFAIAILSVRKLLDINSAKEFGDKMKNILPTKDGDFVKQFEPLRLPRNSSTSKSNDNTK